MSFLSDPDSNEENRPWWAGSRPRWRSPWSLDEEEEPVAAPVVKEEVKPRVEVPKEEVPTSRALPNGLAKGMEVERVVVPKV